MHTTDDRAALTAWLGPAADDLTPDQIDRLAAEARIIGDRYPGADHRAQHEAAMTAAVQYLLGEVTVEQAGAERHRTLDDEQRAKAAAIQVAAMAVADAGGGEASERRIAADAGINRGTLRARLGKQ